MRSILPRNRYPYRLKVLNQTDTNMISTNQYRQQQLFKNKKHEFRKGKVAKTVQNMEEQPILALSRRTFKVPGRGQHP